MLAAGQACMAQTASAAPIAGAESSGVGASRAALSTACAPSRAAAPSTPANIAGSSPTRESAENRPPSAGS